MKEKSFLPREETFIDCTGATRTFRIFQFPTDGRPVESGYVITAEEITGDASGYEFNAWSPCLGDCLGKLRRKIRRGLASRHVVVRNGELSMLQDKISGIISSGGMVIDGSFYDWDSLIKLFSVYEGSQADLVFTDPAE